MIDLFPCTSTISVAVATKTAPGLGLSLEPPALLCIFEIKLTVLIFIKTPSLWKIYMYAAHA